MCTCSWGLLQELSGELPSKIESIVQVLKHIFDGFILDILVKKNLELSSKVKETFDFSCERSYYPDLDLIFISKIFISMTYENTKKCDIP